MKKFYAKALFFSAIIITTLIGLDFAITEGLKKDRKSNRAVWNDIYNGVINSDIIINGSSRAVYHIDPRIVSSTLKKQVYNLGMDGQMFELQYCRFKVYLEHNPPPKIVVQGVDCHTLCKTKELYEYQQFLPYLKDSTLKSCLIDKKGLGTYDYILPMARYSGEFILALKALKLVAGVGDNTPDRYFGYQGQDRPWNNDLEAAKKMYPDKLTYNLDSNVLRLFEGYIQYCKKQDIKLILVYTPEYIEGQKLIKNRTEIIGLYEKISKKYQVPFLNYSDSNLSKNKNLFYNALHLNITGAEQFTAQLSKDIIGLNTDLPEGDAISTSSTKAPYRTARP